MSFTPFRREFTVRFHEVDSEGVVFNAWYLTWMHDTAVDYLTSIGLSPSDLKAAGIAFRIVHADLTFKASLGLQDCVEVEVSTAKVGNTSYTLDFRLLRGETLIAESELTYVTVDSDGVKMVVPEILRSALV